VGSETVREHPGAICLHSGAIPNGVKLTNKKAVLLCRGVNSGFGFTVYWYSWWGLPAHGWRQRGLRAQMPGGDPAKLGGKPCIEHVGRRSPSNGRNAGRRGAVGSAGSTFFYGRVRGRCRVRLVAVPDKGPRTRPIFNSGGDEPRVPLRAHVQDTLIRSHDKEKRAVIVEGIADQAATGLAAVGLGGSPFS